MFNKNFGFSMVEVMVAMGLVGLAAFGITNSISNHLKVQRIVDFRHNQSQILESMFTLVKNEKIKNVSLSIAANSSVRAHLNPAVTAASATNIGSAIKIVDPTGNVVIDIGGSLYTRGGAIVSKGKARWKVFAFWEGTESNSAKILIKIEAVNPKAKKIANAKYSSVYWRPIGQKCIYITKPLVAGVNGAHSNYGAPLEYVWDHTIVKCPNPYLRVSLAIEQGCNAMSARKFGFYWNQTEGSCHQVSAQTPEQRADCAPGSWDGTCKITCCRFD